jgi:hypothetical protein
MKRSASLTTGSTMMRRTAIGDLRRRAAVARVLRQRVAPAHHAARFRASDVLSEPAGRDRAFPLDQ